MRFCRFLIVTVLAGLSMATAQDAYAQKDDVRRCVAMRLDQSAAEVIGYGLKKTRWRGTDFSDSGVVVMQPRMAGLIGPSVTMLGRDVRLAVAKHQTSPQELWHKARWNETRVDGCVPPKVSTIKQFMHALYYKMRIDTEAGFTTYQPKIMYRSRAMFDMMFTRPYGFILGASAAVPLADNTASLLYLPDTRGPVRRDMARFSDGIELERLYASWRHSPLTDVHVALSAGWIEEMYGGAGMEAVWRPFGSPFWVGADAWKVWRRDADDLFNVGFTNATRVTGHVRAGYDVPESRLGFSLAMGQYLAGDTGATLGLTQSFENGVRFEAQLTWSDRKEAEGFMRDTHFDPSVRVVFPLGSSKHRDARFSFRQIGRDGGQMLDRPLPLEAMTEGFSAREMARAWPRMFE